MAGPTAAKASRLAGNPTVGTTPKWYRITGVTPAWAATVVAAASPTGPGRNDSRVASGEAKVTNPTVAATDS
jgi:hypothetical protein